MGLDEALDIEEEVFSKISPIIINRLSRTLGFEIQDGIPSSLINMPKEKLINLITALSVNWLADDGIWFQTVENRYELYTSKRCNDTCWTRYSPLEARTIKSFLNIPEEPGLEGLEKALNFRLYAQINKQTIERTKEKLIFKMVACRVQEARKRKGLTDYPCKSGGIIEYSTFASTIDHRIKTECIACPPDEHPDDLSCAWIFYIP